MARSRRPERDKACQLWLESRKTRALKDIAAELGVSDVQVRKWKSQDDWEGKDKGTLPKRVKGNVPKKKRERGGQPGNRNAEGHGAPLRNKNNFKHGIYERVLYTSLTPEEQEIMDDRQIEVENELLMDIGLCNVKIARLMKRIKELENSAGGLVISGVTHSKGTYMGSTTESRTTTTVASYELYLKYNNELERTRKGKERCLAELYKIRKERESKDENSVENDGTVKIKIGEDIF